MRDAIGLALLEPGGTLAPFSFQRRDLRPADVAVRITHCGVCFSDLSALRSVPAQQLPLVPGHEFTGVVSAVGPDVTKFAVGDPVAVGNIVDSCGECANCLAGFENYCIRYPTPTYLGRDRHDGSPQQGAYSSEYVVAEKWAYPLAATLDPAAAAPLMCAGITVWEALTHWEVGTGRRVGVVGLGGLGHLGVKFAKALGAEVALFTTSPGKEAAARALGADDVIVSRDSDAMRAQAGRFDFIVDTASAGHDPSPYLDALRLHGTLCMLGISDRIDVASFSLRWGRHSLAGSGTGSPATTQQMLDFCAEHDLTADVEVLPAHAVQTALDRLARNDVRYRFVLDLTQLPRSAH